MWSGYVCCDCFRVLDSFSFVIRLDASFLSIDSIKNIRCFDDVNFNWVHCLKKEGF